MSNYKIAVFGFYNSLNTGDDRLQACITRILGPVAALVFLPHHIPPCPEFLRTFDWILIGGGGLIFERAGIWTGVRKWLRSCKAHVGVLGIGVNRIDPELMREVQDLLNVSSFFYVRDARSKELLNNDPRVKVLPDLTWAFPFRRGARAVDPESIALNLAPCYWKNFDAGAWVNALSGKSLVPFPFFFTHSQDYGLLRKHFGDAVPAEFTMQPLECCGTLVASRYHAIVFAMQMRVSFVAIAYDEKVRRVADDAGLGDFCLETHEHALLVDTMERLKSEREAVEARIDAYASSQESLGIELVHRVRKKIGINEAGFP